MKNCSCIFHIPFCGSCVYTVLLLPSVSLHELGPRVHTAGNIIFSHSNPISLNISISILFIACVTIMMCTGDCSLWLFLFWVMQPFSSWPTLPPKKFPDNHLTLNGPGAYVTEKVSSLEEDSHTCQLNRQANHCATVAAICHVRQCENKQLASVMSPWSNNLMWKPSLQECLIYVWNKLAMV